MLIDRSEARRVVADGTPPRGGVAPLRGANPLHADTLGQEVFGAMTFADRAPDAGAGGGSGGALSRMALALRRVLGGETPRRAP